MTTQKPSNVTSAIGAYTYKSGVSSTATNYIDNTFPNLLDKTGDNAGNGGGISGEVDVLSGGEINILSGATLNISSGGTFTINSGVTANLTGVNLDAIHYHLTSYTTGPQTLSSTTGVVILVNTTSAAITITLPASQNGRVFKIKDVGMLAMTNAITIATPGSETIDGLTQDYVMNGNGQGIELVADASSNWWIVSTS